MVVPLTVYVTVPPSGLSTNTYLEQASVPTEVSHGTEVSYFVQSAMHIRLVVGKILAEETERGMQQEVSVVHPNAAVQVAPSAAIVLYIC